MASIKRRRHTPDQLIPKLAEGNKLLAGGTGLDEVCRPLEIAESTWHRRLARFGLFERQACIVIGAHGSTMRLTPPPITIGAMCPIGSAADIAFN